MHEISLDPWSIDFTLFDYLTLLLYKARSQKLALLSLWDEFYNQLLTLTCNIFFSLRSKGTTLTSWSPSSRTSTTWRRTWGWMWRTPGPRPPAPTRFLAKYTKICGNVFLSYLHCSGRDPDPHAFEQGDANLDLWALNISPKSEKIRPSSFKVELVYYPFF